jgi:hypothetical protein
MQREKSVIERGIVGGNSGCISCGEGEVSDKFCEKKTTFLSVFPQMICAFIEDYSMYAIAKYCNTVSDCRIASQGFASIEISHDWSHKGGEGVAALTC